MFGAMNTMYAAVAYRTREIGTLRALGFSRSRIVYGVPGRIDRAGAGRRRDRLPAGAAGARAVDRDDEHDQLQRSGVQVPNHAGAAGRRSDVFRGDGSGRRPAPGNSRGPYSCRPCAARDLTVLPNIRSDLHFLARSGVARCWCSPCRSAGRSSGCGRCRTSCAPIGLTLLVPPLPRAPRVQDEPRRALRLGVHRHRGDAEGAAVVGRAITSTTTSSPTATAIRTARWSAASTTRTSAGS